jgi:hypothetical protein
MKYPKSGFNVMNAQGYFDAVVMPTYEEFQQDRSNLRRALLAALVIYHVLDYVNADRGGTKGKLAVLQKQTGERCAAFKGVEALANGTKHVKLRGPDPFSPDDIEALVVGSGVDRRKIEQDAVREFKTGVPMFWFCVKDKKHLIDVDLFAALKYVACEFELRGAENIQLPMQVIYKDTAE